MPGSTQEIMLVKDKVNWQRFYWNNVSQTWFVSVHDVWGWTNCGQMTTDELASEQLHN